MSEGAETFKGLNAEILAVNADGKHSHRAWINAPKNGLRPMNWKAGDKHPVAI